MSDAHENENEDAASPRRWSQLFETQTAAIVVVVIHAVLLLRSAFLLSPTIDEPAHLASGIRHWKQGRFDLYRVNPPLVRMIGAVPVLAAGVTAETKDWHNPKDPRPEFAAGMRLMMSNGDSGFRFVTLARLPVLAFSVIGAVYCGIWAVELFGPQARLPAVVMWCFHPLILGHGALLTADVAAATAGCITARLFSRWLTQPRWIDSAAWGVALGFGLSIKSTWCLLSPIWPAIWIVFRCFRRRPGMGAEALQLLVGAILSATIVNSVYLWRDVGVPLGEYQFSCGLLGGKPSDTGAESLTGNRFLGTIVGALPVPLPADYVYGMDLQRVDFERGTTTWMFGEKRTGPVPEFYPIALTLKTPVGLLIAGLLSLVVLPRLSLENGLILFGISISLFAALISNSTVNHVRYAIPILPFAIVYVSGSASVLFERRVIFYRSFMSVVFWGAASSAMTSPWHISYLNEFVRPGKSTAMCLVDSQTDWGQGLLAVRDWLKSHPEVEDLKLAYYGSVPPSLAGIDFEIPPIWPVNDDLALADDSGRLTTGPQAGWYAISGSLLVGADGRVLDQRGRSLPVTAPSFRWLLTFEPVATPGGSIFVFNVTDADVLSLRQRPGLIPELERQP